MVKKYIKNGLEALFAFTHAPGRSAYNPVEKRMGPLSVDRVDLITPFGKYGSHLIHEMKP